MATESPAVRLLRFLPAISSTATLQFALDTHLIFGTWVHPSVDQATNAYLAAWWTQGGLRWQWVIILGYPANYAFAILNLLIDRNQLTASGSTGWYIAGLIFSVLHMVIFARKALGLIYAIERNEPKDNVSHSMAGWLRTNWIRALTTDLPAWLCFITAALKAM